MNRVVLGLTLAAMWLLWSGHFSEVLLLSFGLISVLVVVWLSDRMDATDRGALTMVYQAPKMVLYIPWLVVEILKANWDVIKRVWSFSPAVDPVMVDVTPIRKDEVGLMIYANSITLTPGTVSVLVDEDHIAVHGIAPEVAEDVVEGTMNRRVAAMEGK